MHQLDESTAHRHLKSSQALSGWFLQPDLGHDQGHEWPPIHLVQCQSGLPFWDTAISKFDHENPWSRTYVWSKVKVAFHLGNSKVKVMAKVKPDGHIWGLEFNRYVCFWFRGNRTIFGWYIANSIFDLENSRSRSWPRSNPVVTFEALGLIDILSWQSDHFWDTANPIFDLKNSRSRSWPRSNPMVIFEA